MSKNSVELIASYWTIAGDTYPGAPSEISPFSLQQRAEAAGKAGWKGMGLVHADIVHAVEHYGLPTVRRIFEDNDIRHLEVEFLVNWHLDGAKRQASDRMRDDLLEIGGALGARNLKCAAGLFESGEPDMPRMRAAFADVCERAAGFGLNVVVEFLPFASVNNIDRALQLVQDGHPAGGILIDTWHVARGGMAFEEISRIPPDLIRSIELDDAGPVVIESMVNDSTHHRMCCGEGVLDVPGFIQTVVDTGYQGPWGVELISAELRKLPLEEVVRRTYDTTMAQFENIRFPSAHAA